MLTVRVLETAQSTVATLVATVTPPDTALAGGGEGQQVPVVGRLRHQGRVVAVGGAGEEVTVLTAGVLSAGALPLLAGVRGQAARLTAVVLSVPEAAPVVTVVLSTDETLATVNIRLAVSLPRLTHPHIVPHTAVSSSPALHLQALHHLRVHHDGQGRLPRGGVLQEGEGGQLTGAGGLLVVVTVTQAGLTLVTAGQVISSLHRQLHHGGEGGGGHVPGGRVPPGVLAGAQGRHQGHSQDVCQADHLEAATVMSSRAVCINWKCDGLLDH